MATVYLAVDLKHDRPVALKVLRPELAATLGPDRFLREIRFTARLDHPHIVPVLDSGEAAGRLWYTMPYVRGESLRERLRREVQLPVDVAVELTRQVALALTYAHREGVVHRDLKPENILVCDDQARLADLGVAKALSPDTNGQLTDAGLALGTPTYMSPEQAVGGLVDGRTDVYALACVLYEMLAGEPPFGGPNAQAIIARKAAEPARSLRTVRDTVPPALDRAVLKALARVPADRYPTAAAFATALTASHGAGGIRPRWWRPRALGVAALSLSIVAGLAFVFRPGLRDHARSPDPRRVLVTPFENQTGDSSLGYVGDIATDWLIRELQGTEVVQVVDQRALAADTSAAGRALVRRAGAGTLIGLSYYRLGDSLRFQARVTASSSGARLYTARPVTASLGSPMEPLAALGHDLVSAVITAVAPGVEWRGVGDRPPSFQAYREFMSGMALLPRLDFEGAIRHWFRAAQLDTTFITPLLSAASFMLVSGQNARADSVVSSIEKRGERLRPSERQRVDNLRARLQGNIPDALNALAPLAEAAPLSEAAWELALHELWLNRPRQAVTAFERLDPSWEFLRGWWFYWVFYCNAHHLLGEYQTELSVARRGRTQYPNSIRATEPEIAALAALGRSNEVRRVLETTGTMPPVEPGDLERSMLIAALELDAHEQPEAAKEVLRRVAELQREWSAEERAAVPDWLPGMVAYVSGRWEEARHHYTELAARDSNDVNVQGHLGVIAARTGQRHEAMRISTWLEQANQPYLYGFDTLWRARIAALLGEHERAMTLLRLAFGEGLKFVGTFSSDPPARTFGPWLHRDVDLLSLHSLPEFSRLARGTH